MAGIDEAGRGCLASARRGPAAVILEEYDLPGLTDSGLSAASGAVSPPLIRPERPGLGAGRDQHPPSTRINILQATFRRPGRAVAGLKR